MKRIDTRIDVGVTTAIAQFLDTAPFGEDEPVNRRRGRAQAHGDPVRPVVPPTSANVDKLSRSSDNRLSFTRLVDLSRTDVQPCASQNGPPP